MKTNYVLIDYENVQPAAMAALDQEHVKIIVFVGSSQTKIPFDVASALQQMGPRAEYVKVSGNGANALDFHIAFYIGQLSARDPGARFHIISKDAGFDPLIQHLKDKKVRVCRSPDVADISAAKLASSKPVPEKAAHSKSLSEKVTTIVANLRLYKSNKPRTVKTLSGTINAFFQKKLSEEEVSLVVQELQKQGFVIVKDTAVSYNLPA